MRPKGSKNLSPDVQRQIAQAYASGLLIREIAAQFSVSHGSVCKAARLFGIPSFERERKPCVRRPRRRAAVSATYLYKTWGTMRQRCNNPNNPGFHHYGGRGIKVCDRWEESFENFRADVGERPTPKHSLDRINNNGHYEPGNVRWATRFEQARNRRSNRILALDGITLTASEWMIKLGLPERTLYSRLNKGWCDACALTRPRITGEHYSCLHK